ncbi:P-loop containing nucleoside triphosphate hydrolase protein [Peziza echinospora]|nr:P-loop containing nucleoside triphosphate hydrolase protein [Peziza echinospora]
MSRHQNIRNMNLADELGDYDYDYDSGDYEGEEMSEDDKIQMKIALSKVRAVIGSEIPGLSDKKIEDTLWDYYYDVEKTVNYILNTYRPGGAAKIKKKAQPKAQATIPAGGAFAGPSPDDVVIAAQSQSRTIGSAKPKAKEVVTQEAADAIKNLSISSQNTASLTADIERVARTRKNLNVPEEHKKSLAKESSNFVVIGHVDAGKSTLMGRLLYDLGVVDERTIQKYKHEAEKIGKSSFAFAWVLDQTKEERNRGVTIDFAANRFETEKTQFTILDAPGHRDFIPNMIAGASQADFAVLVVDSTTGEFETGFNFRGQTKEHTLLVRSMGVQRIIVAVNKLDNMNWSQDRFEEIQQQLSQFLTTAGFQSQNIAFVPCSGLTGDNITKKPKSGIMPWYSGTTLVEELEKSKPLTRAIEKPLRLTVTDVFRGGVMNPVSISGRIEAGTLQVGDVIQAMPTGEKAAIKGIEIDDTPKDWAVAGHNVVLHLSGIDMVHLRAGDILCDPKNPVPAVTSFTMKILAFESITPMMVDVHRGRLNVSGKVSKLIATMDKSTGVITKKKPRHIVAGALASIQVEVSGSGIPVEAHSRIVLRAEGQTIAAGLVERVGEQL